MPKKRPNYCCKLCNKPLKDSEKSYWPCFECHNKLKTEAIRLFNKGMAVDRIAERLGYNRKYIDKHIIVPHKNSTEKYKNVYDVAKRGKFDKRYSSGTAQHKNQEEAKKAAVAYKGGSCSICGYDKCLAALQFHHRDPTDKKFGLTRTMLMYGIPKLVFEELDKCDLLCANCHAEEHDRIRNGSGD